MNLKTGIIRIGHDTPAPGRFAPGDPSIEQNVPPPGGFRSPDTTVQVWCEEDKRFYRFEREGWMRDGDRVVISAEGTISK